jgi:hypothetical protein
MVTVHTILMQGGNVWIVDVWNLCSDIFQRHSWAAGEAPICLLIYLFIYLLMTRAVAQTTKYWTLGWLMYYEFEMLWKEVVMACFKVLSSICMKRLRKPTETLGQGSCYPIRDSNWTPLECKSEALLSELTCSVGDILKSFLALKCTFECHLLGPTCIWLFSCLVTLFQIPYIPLVNRP